MLKIYGSMQCPDCVECCEDLKKARIEFEFCDFAHSLLNLKEFLAIRDSDAQFAGVRKAGMIGIPCIVNEDGTVSLTWEEYVSQDNA